jgi:hypothetical protein
MLTTLLALPSWLIVLLLSLFLGTTGVLIHCVSFMPSNRARVATFVGLVGPFFGSPAILFALLTGFLANDAWTQDRRAGDLVLEEHEAVAIMIDLAATLPPEAASLEPLVRGYVRSVLTDEAMASRPQPTSHAEGAIVALLHAVMAPAFGQQVGPALQGVLIRGVERIADARAARLAMAESLVDDAKWFAALALAVLSQVGAAAVHLEKRRVQALALTIFTASAVVLLGLVAICEEPYLGSHPDVFGSMRDLVATAKGG